jgi:hypothetical protein
VARVFKKPDTQGLTWRSRCVEVPKRPFLIIKELVFVPHHLGRKRIIATLRRVVTVIAGNHLINLSTATALPPVGKGCNYSKFVRRRYITYWMCW